MVSPQHSDDRLFVHPSRGRLTGLALSIRGEARRFEGDCGREGRVARRDGLSAPRGSATHRTRCGRGGCRGDGAAMIAPATSAVERA